MYTFTKLHDRRIPTRYPNPDSLIAYPLSVCVCVCVCVARTAADEAVVIVAVVVVTLAEISAVRQLRVRQLTDGVTDAPAALATAVTATHRARVVPAIRRHWYFISPFLVEEKNKQTIIQ